MTPAQLLDALLMKHRHTANSLGKELENRGHGGGAQVAMSRLLAGKNVRVTTLAPIADYFGVDPSAFVTEKAATEAAEALGLTRRETGGSPVAVHHDGDVIPAGFVAIKESSVKFSAGPGYIPTFEVIEDSAPVLYKAEYFHVQCMNPDFCVRFKVKGQSMEPLLYDGDVVLVNTLDREVIDGRVYALRYGEELRIKRVYRKLDGGLILHSDNENYMPRNEELTPDMVREHIAIIGRVRDKSGSGGL